MELKMKFDDKLIALGEHLFGTHIWEKDGLSKHD